ncbi:MAG: c-type cytochrome biogenesis protein CcsB [Pedobacter sp.]|nr:MAG: c-type cytochrome biogenesis protein CcsB [Pedobacter sp.]
MAMGTFVENDYGTPVAKALIYDCWWFELIMIILVLNFIGNINRYRLYQRKKLPLLVFHLAFVLIFIGGAVTRYISFEGSMTIREGESSNAIITDKTFFKIHIGNENNALSYKDIPVTLLSDRVPFYLKPFKKDFEEEYDFYGERIKLKVIGFYPRAQDSLIKDPGGVSTLHLVVLENGKRVNKYITSGNVLLVQNLLVSFNQETAGAINISNTSGRLQISSPYEGNYMIMTTQERKTVSGNDEANEFHMRSLYTYGSLAFVVPEAPGLARIMHLEGDKKTHENDPDLVQLAITTSKATDTVSFYGGRGLTDFQHQVQVGDLRLSLAYGSKIYETPFSLKLTDFNRFFQSSFYPDEKGTILSVNHDAWGTNITYIGYTLLFLGMFVTLFWRGTHFSKLNEQLKQLSKTTKVTLLCLSFLALAQGAYSQEIDMHGKNGPQEQEHHEHDGHDHSGHDHGPAQPPSESEKANMRQMLSAQPQDAKSFAATVQIDAAHADRFGRLLVQDFDGRIEPVNTLALEILRKIHGKERFHSLTANQFLLAISSSPLKWLTVPLIHISGKGGQETLKKLKADENGYTTMINLLTLGEDGSAEFILSDDYRKAFAKKPADQGTYDKFVLELNDKLYAMQQLIDGHYLRILPLAGDQNNTWVAMPYDPVNGQLNNPAALYLSSVVAAQTAGNWKSADDKLNHIKQLQLKHGKDVVPSEAKIEWEIRYNSWNLFLKIMVVYSILGTIILALAFVRLFKQNKLLDRLVLVLLILIGTAAALQAMGLGVRWYISGHEPWSNGYEAVLFISWIGVLSGMLLYRNSNAFILAAGCLIAVILMGFAHGGSQMNPQITPLVPVLKSYWLMIHVAIITSSYGFFGLSALLGAVVLILFIIDNDKIAAKVKSSVAELTIVNELSLTVGVFLLTVGTFLGGIWANESWGRYWSWDPKETWAFISVIIYAFVLHVRLIPKMQGKYLFNLLSLISFSTIIMTYFGVNYYLSGLHSYAQGDPVPVPGWVYITVAVVFLLALVAYLRYAKRKRKPIK